jgi:predicted permease
MLQGKLDKAGCQTLAAICFYFFVPALTFSKLGSATSVSALRQLWPVLANMALRWVCIRVFVRKGEGRGTLSEYPEFRSPPTH